VEYREITICEAKPSHPEPYPPVQLRDHGVHGQYRTDVTSITVTPTLLSPTARLTVNGEGIDSGQARTIPLNGVGSNRFVNIVVVAENGTPKIYTVNVVRAAFSGNNNLSEVIVSPGALVTSFSDTTE